MGLVLPPVQRRREPIEVLRAYHRHDHEAGPMQQPQRDNHGHHVPPESPAHHDGLARLAARGRVNASSSFGRSTTPRSRPGVSAGRYVATAVSASGFVGLVAAMGAAPPSWSQDEASEPIALTSVTTLSPALDVTTTPPLGYVDEAAVPASQAPAPTDPSGTTPGPGPVGVLGPAVIRPGGFVVDGGIGDGPFGEDGLGALPPASPAPARPATTTVTPASPPSSAGAPETGGGSNTQPASTVVPEFEAPDPTTPAAETPTAETPAPPPATAPPATAPPTVAPPPTGAPTTIPPTTIPPTTLPECVGSSC